MSSNTGIVKLNIGGTLFHTTKSTLTKFDGFFKTILQTEVPVTKDVTEAFFIDRDPTHFRLILNFMRDGDVELPTGNKEIKEILREAQYYLLTGLVELCSKHSLINSNTDIVKILHSDLEELAAVINSEKPVLVISLGGSYNFCCGKNTNDWKQFVARHSINWNIFIKKIEALDIEGLSLHATAKESFTCPIAHFGINQCGLRATTILNHIEHHMNQFL